MPATRTPTLPPHARCTFRRRTTNRADALPHLLPALPVADYAFAARAASRSTPRANALARSGQHPADDESDGVDASLPQLPGLGFSFIAHSSSSLTSSVAEAFMQLGQYRIALRGARVRVRLSMICGLSFLSLVGRLTSCVHTHVLSNYRMANANALLDATPPVLWLALTAASGRRALVTAENYERIVFGCAMLCLGFRYLSAFFGSRDLQVQDTPALSEPWVPPELLPSFLLVGGLMRVVLLFVSAIVVMGLQPTAALVVSLTDAAGTLMRLFRSQIFVGPAPAWVVYLLLLGVNIGVIFCCALYYAGLEQRAFSLHQELQTAKNDRIEQLAGEKERLHYGVPMPTRA